MFSFYPQHRSNGLSLDDLLTSSRYGCQSNNSYHNQRRQQQLRQQQLRDAYLRELQAEQEQQHAYEVALKAERARRLAETQARQGESAEEEMVQVQLPDGRRYLVPRSWLRAQQEKSSAAQREPSPTPIGEREDSTLLEAAEPLTGPAQTEPVRIPISSPSRSAKAPRRQATHEEREAAATKLQRFARRNLRLKHLHSIRDRFHAARDEFSIPALDSLVFDAAPESNQDSGVPRLAFGTPANRQVQEYEERLLKFLLELDGVESSGMEEVKKARKNVVREVERELERLDEAKAEVWRLKCGQGLKPTEKKDEAMTVESEGNETMVDGKQDGGDLPENAVPVESATNFAEAPMEVEAPTCQAEVSVEQVRAPTSDSPNLTLGSPGLEAESTKPSTDALPSPSPTLPPDVADEKVQSEPSSDDQELANYDSVTFDDEFATADEEAWDILDDETEDEISDGQKTPLLLEKELGEVLMR